MEFRKSALVLSALIFTSSSQASVIIGNSYGSELNYVNNGVVTTEYQNGVAVREWLDLTVTNGITLDSVIDDLSDDNYLNNSSGLINGGAGYLADVLALDSSTSFGWNVASIESVATLLTDFFGVTVNTFDTYAFGSNIYLSENFIELFGDTYHEGNEDSGASDPDANPSLANIGYSFGSTSTIDAADFSTYAYISDGQFEYSLVDDSDDLITTFETLNIYTLDFDRGVWLYRDIASVSVDLPASHSLFLMGLAVLFVRSRKVLFN